MVYRFDEFAVDPDGFELCRDGVPRRVEPRVFDLILYLVRNPDRVVSRDELIEHVWNGRVVSDATVSSCVKSARRALDDSGGSQGRIKTVRGRGFRFVGEVSGVAAGAGPDRDLPAPPEPPGPPAPGDDAGTPERPVVAVLPFENLSAGIDEYFADGLTVDIITNLSRFREFHVIARSSTFRFKGEPVDLEVLRRELGASYVVEGSVRRAAGRVRISMQLADAGTGVQLWAESYDREMEDIFALQDDVTRTVAATLGVKVQDAGTRRALGKSPAELGAYDRVLRARRYTWTLDAASHAEARDLLESAVSLDPGYADAHALLANVYLAEHRFDANPRPKPVERALAAAETAVRLDPQNAHARCWLAIVHFFRHENDRFEDEARRALALNPNDPEILADVGHFYAFMGRFEQGIELSARARRLNPLHPGWYYFSSVRYHYHRRDYAAALADVERAGMPDFYWSHLIRAAALGQLGRPEARDAVDRLRALKPGIDARAELVKWNAAPDDLAHLLEGLGRAGLG